MDATKGLTIMCPRLTNVCPEMFCKANCAGRGDCDWTAKNENGTIAPKCNCFNVSDTTEVCYDSLLLDGKYISDSDGIGSGDRKKFLIH